MLINDRLTSIKKHAITICVFLAFIATLFSWFLHPFFAFLKFVPLLFIISSSQRFRVKLIAISITFFLENAFVTGWLKEFSIPIAYILYLINTAAYTLPFAVVLLIEKKKKAVGFLMLPLLIAFIDCLYNELPLNLSWIAAGNVFGSKPEYIQWYKYFGAVGGTVWIGYVNVLIYQMISALMARRPFSKTAFYTTLAIFLPCVWSLLLSWQSYPKGSSLRAVFAHTVNEDQGLSVSNILFTSGIKGDFLLLPETFISNTVWDIYKKNPKIRQIQSSVDKKIPQIIAGVDLELFDDNGPLVDKILGQEYRYKKYNAGISFTADSIQVTAKKLLVPFEEYLPSVASRFLKYKSCNYSIETDVTNSISCANTSCLLLICYEIVNSTFISESISENDGFICLVTGEKFFHGKKYGMDQYLNIARIRAIEFQKFVVKSSDKGYAACIDPRGIVKKQSDLGKSDQILVDDISALPGKSIYCYIVQYLWLILLMGIGLIWYRQL